jgi:CTP:molybdopterin cytidylyltransferase MocA
MTLREFLTERTDAVSFLESSDPGLATDIDTPEDYERARQLSATRPS